MKPNICLLTDSYKLTHHSQYPTGTTKVYSYFESRVGAKYDETVFFGLQYILKKYLEGVVVTKEMVDQAESLAAAHFGNPDIFKRERWDYIIEKHGGKLPLEIKAVPEGTPVPVSNVLMTVENTDPECYWLTNHVESLLTHIWSPCTVATQSREAKKIISGYLERTASSSKGLNFMLHDFGYRGVSSNESAMLAGASHLVNFFGTDTVPAMQMLMEYYGSECPAFSVPATEHSVMTSMGESGEQQLFKRILDTYPTGILSVVIDSYNYKRFIRMAAEYKDQILSREGKLVFRPDSGNPVAVTKQVLELLDEYFGSTQNEKGYYELNPKVGMLWGDGIDIEGMRRILQAMEDDGWSASNIVFGMGGGLLQKVNRDTQRFAFKCSYQERGGMGFDIFKNPLDHSKASKKGRLKLLKCGKPLCDSMCTQPESEEGTDVLQTVFKNGEVVKEYTLEDCRKNAEIPVLELLFAE